MYGWLTLNEDNQLELNYPKWDFLTSPTLSDEAKKARIAQGVSGIRAAFPDGQDTDLIGPIAAAVSAALKHVTEDQVDYAIHMGVAFYRLHRVDHMNVRAEIAKQVDKELATPQQGADPAINEMIDRLKAVSFLLPPLSRPYMLNAACTELRMDILAKKTVTELVPLRTAAGNLYNLWDKSDKSADVFNTAHRALASCTTTELQDTATCIRNLLISKRTDVFVELWQRYLATEEALLRVLRHRALREGLKTAAARPNVSAGQIASDAFADVQAWNELDNQILERSTIAAIDSGINLGTRTLSSREALRKVRDLEAHRQQDHTQALIAHARQRNAQQPQTVSTNETDSGTLQSWSVYELTRWIEGPVADPRRTKRLDRQQVIERSRASRVAPQPTTSGMDHAASASRPGVGPMTEADVACIATQAYGAAAGYFLGDIGDFVTLGKKLQVTPELVSGCVALTAQLTQLAQAPEKFDEQQALELLTKAEHAIQLLRENIKTTQTDLARQEHFQTQLLNALAGETLTLGRRQGGVIACPLTAEDWRWVSVRFHRRWLACTRNLLVNGVQKRLEVEEALALYVTGTSQSNYAFDVSVHLWRRWPGRTGRTGLPSLEQGVFPSMNTGDWYDTFISCCVLHVPLSQ